MRSSLLSFSKNCPLSKSCTFCKNLGYLNTSSTDVVADLNSQLEFSISESFVLPCSSHADSRYSQVTEALIKKNKLIKRIFLFEYWKQLPPEEAATFNNLQSAIVFSKFSDLHITDTVTENYFLVTKQNWRKESWESLDPSVRKKLKYFFLPNIYDEGHILSPSEIFSIYCLITSVDPQAQFSYPFGHDVLDKRNADHLNWNLYPKITSFDSRKMDCKVQISIIIPFYNRSYFLKSILENLKRQKLSRNDFEIILVDDGSDQTNCNDLSHILNQAENLQIKAVYVERNIGLTGFYIGNRAGPIRNLGVSLSRGEIILFLDSDIILPSDYLIAIIGEHRSCDVLLPKRVYLTKESSSAVAADLNNELKEGSFEPEWYGYIKTFYNAANWPMQVTPWKYCITYCLSMNRQLFMKAGGFRTSFISFGYEDLDLGFRITQLTKKLRLLDCDVFHLYHFDSGSEYTLDMDFRFFQLAMTSRSFFVQNVNLDTEYLIKIATLKNLKQKYIYMFFRILWFFRKLFNFFQIKKFNFKNW